MAKISPDADLCCVAGGDWDLTRRVELADAVKHRAIYQHFVHGRPWIDTDLFRENYAERLLREPVKQQKTLKDLARLYEQTIDALFVDMKRNGFNRQRRLPRVVIGRDGEIFLTNQGNHRIAIAKILNISTIPCRVQCRHLAWVDERHWHKEHPDGA
jgi:hypothetical protein